MTMLWNQVFLSLWMPASMLNYYTSAAACVMPESQKTYRKQQFSICTRTEHIVYLYRDTWHEEID